MDAPEILSKLKLMLNQIYMMNDKGRTNNLTNEVRILASDAAYLIIKYPLPGGWESTYIKVSTLEMLEQDIIQANLYYETAAGYDAEKRKNDNVKDIQFINPVFGVLDYFINEVEGGENRTIKKVNDHRQFIPYLTANYNINPHYPI